MTDPDYVPSSTPRRALTRGAVERASKIYASVSQAAGSLGVHSLTFKRALERYGIAGPKSKDRYSLAPIKAKMGRNGDWDGWARLSAAVVASSFHEIQRLQEGINERHCHEKDRDEKQSDIDTIVRALKNPLNPFVVYLDCKGHHIDDAHIERALELIKEKVEGKGVDL